MKGKKMAKKKKKTEAKPEPKAKCKVALVDKCGKFEHLLEAARLALRTSTHQTHPKTCHCGVCVLAHAVSCCSGVK